jgi:hypothetical protein
MSVFDDLPPVAVEFVKAMAEFMTEHDGARPTRCNVSRECLDDIRRASGSCASVDPDDGYAGTFFDVRLYVHGGPRRLAMSARRSPAGERQWMEMAAEAELLLRDMIGIGRE